MYAYTVYAFAHACLLVRTFWGLCCFRLPVTTIACQICLDYPFTWETEKLPSQHGASIILTNTSRFVFWYARRKGYRSRFLNTVYTVRLSEDLNSLRIERLNSVILIFTLLFLDKFSPQSIRHRKSPENESVINNKLTPLWNQKIHFIQPVLLLRSQL
jgi:hypothetical protein